MNAAPLALNVGALGAAVSDAASGLESTHSEEASINTSSVAPQNLADAQWLRRTARASLRYENKKNI
jgi:hypothetical protein